MTQLASEVELLLKGKLKDESIKVVTEIIDFMKYKEEQEIWAQIDSLEPDEIPDFEVDEIKSIKENSEFIPYDKAINFLENKDENANV